MPITQDRMLALLDFGETCLEHLKALRALAGRSHAEDMASKLNSIAARTEPAQAAALLEIRDHIVALLEILGTNLPEDKLDKFKDERSHFKAHAKQNERTARYMQRKRLGLVGQRASAEPSVTFNLAPQAAPAAPNISDQYTTYDENFVAPPDGTALGRGPKVFDEDEAPIPLTDELVAKLMAESKGYAPQAVPIGLSQTSIPSAVPSEAPPSAPAGALYAPAAPGDNYASQGEAPPVPLPGSDVFP